MNKKAKAEVNGLAIASLIFGAMSILTCWTIILPVPLVLLAFMFALLSRGNKRKCGVAVAGLILGIVGFALTLIVIISILLWLWQLYNNVITALNMAYDYVMSIVNSILYTINSIYTYFDNIVKSFQTIGAFFDDIRSFFAGFGFCLKGGLF